MRNSTLTFLSLGLIALILGSCSTSSDLTNTSVLKKRRYMKGYQVNVKGNNIDKKANAVTAEMEMVDVKPVNEIQPNDMAQASLSNNITEADFAPSPVISTTNASTEKEAAREIKSSPVKVQTQTTKRTRKNRELRNLRNNSNLVVPANAAVASSSESLILYVILAIILPPLAVGLLYGIGVEFIISLLLTLLFWIPGVIYALIKVFQKH